MNDLLGKYSLGIGDRFGHQGKYQLEAFVEAEQNGIEVTPVWNKSHREHRTVNSSPDSVRTEAEEAVKEKKWNQTYLVDADHITLKTVDHFIEFSDFFTLDVADQIGKPLSEEDQDQFLEDYKGFIGDYRIPGMCPFSISKEELWELGNKFYYAMCEAHKIYEKIKSLKAPGSFVTEVSMDEVDHPQTPGELFFILRLLANRGVRLDTIAPKFTGRFNKGVDYEGNLEAFVTEFEQDLLVLDYVIKEFGLPPNLKLSVHTGSDKFSLYPIINRLINKHGQGVHLKTAGTTWLEELIGLAESGGSALQMSKNIYGEALERFDELTVPYQTVLDIDKALLPGLEEVEKWNGAKMANAIRHDPNHPDFNPHFRQLLHTAYKLAAEKGEEFLRELKNNETIIGRNVRENILDRHIKPLFYN